MSLDDRLIDILQHTTQAESIALQMARIKKAFKDEGYVSPEESLETLIKSKRMMTGQEWFDRFEAELAAIPGDEAFTTVEILAAARKAAGL